ncbi:adiponectin receptor protein [Anaeramoeba flamelloides]|uniref:Adiponectin receptor protein n=1 Tax=Anaeramoeba flamelloides TaxID=1746091 RepID=A0AAV7YFJ5_9EUKA|nr:adiponectin receptor protein [Anaeramoeba flamelloides]
MLDTDLNFSFSKYLYDKEITNILLNSAKVENKLKTIHQDSQKQNNHRDQQKSTLRTRIRPKHRCKAKTKRKTRTNPNTKKPFVDLSLTTYSKLPKWLQFNEHIQSGYRFGYSIKNTFKSLFQ